jgi:flagellar hook-associated protein 3 FlgL
MNMRITGQMMLGSSQRNLQASLQKLSNLQAQGTSQKLISKPSDSPSGTADAMRVRSAQAANSQYSRNIDDGLGWLASVDSSLSTSGDILQRVRELTVQGANDGAMSATAKESIAVELEGLRTDLLKQANTTYLGRPLFAGNADTGVAFNPDLSYNGVAGSTVDRRVDANTTVRVDGDGTAAFGVGATSVFALIDTIVSDLRSGTNVGPRLAQIDTSLSAVTAQRSVAGARYNQLERGKELNVEQSGSLESQRANIEDVDLSQVILDLKTQEVAYQSALSVTSRALQPTLLSFLS